MCEIITIGRRLAHASSLTYRFWGNASREESLFGVTPRARNRFLGWRLARGVTPTPARSHPENGGMAPHQFFENNYFSEANQLRVLTVHEGHMGHYHHWRTDDSSSSCFCAIVNVGKMRGVTPTDATICSPSLIVRQISYEIIRPSHGQNIFHMISINNLSQNIFHTS